MSFGGHFWTIAPRALMWIAPAVAPAAVRIRIPVADPDRSGVSLTGYLADRTGTDTCVLLVHGLGGGDDSHYCLEAATAAEKLGVASLRLSLRGADREGTDFYHGGLTADLHAALAAPELARFSRLMIFGFSLGGHVTLRLATEAGVDPRLKAVASLCTPLDLSACRAEIDKPRSWLYRRHLLDGLREIYRGVAARASVPTPLEVVLKIRTMYDWDAATVVRRYGFRDPEHYYATVTVGPVMDRLRLPTLYVAATDDPIVPRSTVDPFLTRPLPNLTVRWIERGGHVGFPRRARVDESILAWLLAR